MTGGRSCSDSHSRRVKKIDMVSGPGTPGLMHDGKTTPCGEHRADNRAAGTARLLGGSDSVVDWRIRSRYPARSRRGEAYNPTGGMDVRKQEGRTISLSPLSLAKRPRCRSRVSSHDTLSGESVLAANHDTLFPWLARRLLRCTQHLLTGPSFSTGRRPCSCQRY